MGPHWRRELLWQLLLIILVVSDVSRDLLGVHTTVRAVIKAF